MKQNKITKVFSFLLVVTLLSAGIYHMPVEAGSSDIIIDSSTYAEGLDNSVWNNPDDDITIEQNTIVFGSTSSEFTRLITKTAVKGTAEVEELVKQNNNALFYAGNFSIGVNMFYRIVENATKLMAEYDEYDTAIWEAHHNQKADSPSGTALDIAKYVMKANPKKTEIVVDAFHSKPQPNQLHVSSTRVGSVPGTHTVFFDSNADTIELTHRARNREGFALGAVCAAEWIVNGLSSGKLAKGRLYTMDDYLSDLIK